LDFLSYIFLAVILLTFISCFLQLFCVYSLSVCRTRHSEDYDNERIYPGISILKPLKGIIPDLEKNLSGFFRLNYPRYEIIFCLENHTDKAVKVVESLKKDYPGVNAKLSVKDRNHTLNPKVDQLIPGYKMASNDIILISDADTDIGKDFLKNLAMHYRELNVGLVSNLIRARGKGSFGAVFENLYMNTFIISGISSLYCLFKHPCVVGKSLSFRKNYLEKMGGFEIVKDHLAEDYILGIKFKEAGKRVVISDYLVNSNTNQRRFGEFLNRNIRWEQMRLKMAGFFYFLDLLVNPVFFAFIYIIIGGFSRLSVTILIISAVIKSLIDVLVGLRIDTPPKRSLSKLSIYLLSPAKDLILAFVWFIPFFKRTVSWGGKKFKLGRNTVLHPLK
jgi:ceramide glucosyltransferase